MKKGLEKHVRGRSLVSDTEVRRILDNATFSMEMEGFNISVRQKEDIKKALEGQGSIDQLIERYIEKARSYGANNA